MEFRGVVGPALPKQLRMTPCSVVAEAEGTVLNYSQETHLGQNYTWLEVLMNLLNSLCNAFERSRKDVHIETSWTYSYDRLPRKNSLEEPRRYGM